MKEIKTKTPSFFEKMSIEDKNHLLALIMQYSDSAIWAIDAGFTVISEIQENNVYIPYWGKLKCNKDGKEEPSGVSDTEISTFYDMHDLYSFIKKTTSAQVIPLLSLSDIRWYSTDNVDRNHTAAERKYALLSRIHNNKLMYIPKEYLNSIKGDEQFIDNLQIILQHEFSSLFKRKIKNKYTNIKRSKNMLQKYKMHYNIYKSQNGWIFFSAKSDEETCYYLSTPLFRLDPKIITNELVRNSCLEGGIGISYNTTDALVGQFCGTISASRLLYVAQRASELNNSLTPKTVITIHIFDKADDHSIDRSLVLGLLAIKNEITLNIHVLIIKDKDHVSVITLKNAFTDYDEFCNIYNHSVNNLTEEQFESDIELSRKRILKLPTSQNCQQSVNCRQSIDCQLAYTA